MESKLDKKAGQNIDNGKWSGVQGKKKKNNLFMGGILIS